MAADISDAIKLINTALLGDVQRLAKGELKLAIKNGSYELCEPQDDADETLFYEPLSSGWLDAHIPPWVMKDDRLRKEMIEYLDGMSGYLY